MLRKRWIFYVFRAYTFMQLTQLPWNIQKKISENTVKQINYNRHWNICTPNFLFFLAIKSWFLANKIMISCPSLPDGQSKNIGAQVLSASLAKVLNLLTTSLTICLFNARENVAKSGEIMQRTTLRYKRRFKVTSRKIYLRKKILSSQKLAEATCCLLKTVPEQQYSKVDK